MKLLKTIKDTFIASFPLAIIIALCLIFSPLDSADKYFKILIGYSSVIVGQSLFLVGLESSILPIGHMMGSAFSKYKNLFFILSFGFIFGLFATLAEPALSVLARQIEGILPLVNTTVFIWVTATGIGIGVAIALVRMVKNINIKWIFAILYIMVFILVLFSPEEFISIAFDGSGATTGDVSVPFILALGIGISTIFSRSKTNDDSFGIVGIASVGPIITVLLFGIVTKIANGGVLPEPNDYVLEISGSLGGIILGNLLDVALAVLPIVIIAIPFLIFLIKLPKRHIFKLLMGVIPVYIGLLIFLSGIDYGFGFVGQYIGQIFVNENSTLISIILLLIVGFLLGFAITVSEPAVTVLSTQIEDLTNGHIKNATIKITLAIGIGFASVISIIKILTQINILYFLVPLYVIALVLMIFTPKLFVGLAFDSGGVTGGALTSAFLTPLTLGIAQSVAQLSNTTMSVLTNGFGIISFISVTPIIAIQLLGVIYDVKSKQIAKQLEHYDSFDDLNSLVKEIKKPKKSIFSRKGGKWFGY